MTIDQGYAFGPEWSAYCWDTRVAWDKLPGGVLAALIDPIDTDANSRLVMGEPGAFVVKGAVNESASLRDGGDRYNERLAMFQTVDEAIAAVIGDPWWATEYETGMGRAIVVPKYFGHLAFEERFVTPNGRIVEVRSEYPHPGGMVVREVPGDYMPLGPEEPFSLEPGERVWMILTWL
jgi:hypothetical protein